MDSRIENKQIWPSELYRPLPLNRKAFCIRLLQILPAESDAPLRCKLVRTTLFDSPTYDALSYTWGTFPQRHTACVNGTTVPITANLECALRDLRHTSKKCMLWVDALCINQNDVHERNSQVQEMGIIYSSAHSVIVHLGLPEKHRDDQVTHLYHQRLKNAYGPCIGLASREEMISARCYASRMAGFLERPWWKRVWVVQEVCRSRKEPIVCIGPDRYINLFDVASSLQLPEQGYYDLYWRKAKTKDEMSSLRRETSAEELDLKIQESEQKIRTPRSTAEFWRDAEQISLLMDIRQRTRQPPRMRDLTAESHDEGQAGQARRRLGEDLLYLLEATRYFDSTDPRDKIFAIWTLARGAREYRLHPDYSMSMQQVYIAVTTQVINGGAGLAILDRRWGRPSPHLPSWVPDYSRAPVALPAFPAKFDLSQDVVNQQSPPTVIMDGEAASFLSTSGVMLDTVSKIVSTRLDNLRSQGQESVEWIDRQRRALESQATEVAGEHEQALLLRLLSLPEETWKVLAQLLISPISSERAGREQPSEHSLVAYETATGFLGLGSEDLCKDDMLVALDGYESLCILRQDETATDYTFRRRAWLHVPDSEVHRLLGLKTQRFHVV